MKPFFSIIIAAYNSEKIFGTVFRIYSKSNRKID